MSRFIRTTCCETKLNIQHVGRLSALFKRSYSMSYNMEEKYIQEKTIKDRILGSLVYCPKTNTQLLQELSYSNKQHGNISKQLHQLKTDGFIVDEKEKSPNIDDYATSWSIVPSLENVRYIAKDPDLVPVLQKKDFALEVMAENIRVSIIPDVIVDIDAISSLKSKKIIIGAKEELYLLLEEPKRKFKEMLRLSPAFFNLHLLHEVYNMMSWSDFEREIEELRYIAKFQLIPSLKIVEYYLYQNSYDFKMCVKRDMFFEKLSDEKKNYLIEIENYLNEEEKNSDAIRNSILKVITHPEYNSVLKEEEKNIKTIKKAIM